MGDAPMKMGSLIVTDTHSRFTYEPDFLSTGLPGLGLMYAPSYLGHNTLPWERVAYFDFPPQIQTLLPPESEENFTRRLILAYLEKQGLTGLTGFNANWAILMVAGHGGIGHVDIFENDQTAEDWYANKIKDEVFTINNQLSFSLKEYLSWMDSDADPLLEILGPTPTVGGAVPKLLLSIPDTGWNGHASLPRRGDIPNMTDVIVKIEKDAYPGMVALEALTLDIHKEAGFPIPRYWTTMINDMPAIAIERYDRTPEGKPLFVETAYSLVASVNSDITDHASGTYENIIEAIVNLPALGYDINLDDIRTQLLKRLLLSIATGNGDLHLENLAFIIRDNTVEFTPVFDPIPMRAYSRHDMLVPMPFGEYGEDIDLMGMGGEKQRHICLIRFCKSIGLSKRVLSEMIPEILSLTDNYNERIDVLKALPDEFKQQLKRVCTHERQMLDNLVATTPQKVVADNNLVGLVS